MLFYGGIAIFVMGVIMLIKFLTAAGRPKLDVPIKEYVMAKVKGDLFGFGGNQKHARVSFDVNGTTHEADVLVGKSINTPVGENIRISYSPKNPKEARYSNPKKEIMMAIVMMLIGAGICVVSMVLSNMLRG